MNRSSLEPPAPPRWASSAVARADLLPELRHAGRDPIRVDEHLGPSIHASSGRPSISGLHGGLSFHALLVALAAPATAKKPAPARRPPPLEQVRAICRQGAAPHPYDELEQLCDEIANRLSGTPALDRAIAWPGAQ